MASVDTTVESGQPEREITWEVVPEDRFRKLLDHTIEETVFQSASGAFSGVQLLEIITPEDTERRDIALRETNKAATDVVSQLRLIQTLLEQDPSKPVPIDHRYESSSGRLIIALDMVGKTPTSQNPT